MSATAMMSTGVSMQLCVCDCILMGANMHGLALLPIGLCCHLFPVLQHMQCNAASGYLLHA
jgi:hypothetical protein